MNANVNPSTRRAPNHGRSLSGAAFTLIELLVVIAIIAIPNEIFNGPIYR